MVYDIDFDSHVAINFPLESGFLFNAQSGERLHAQLATDPGA